MCYQISQSMRGISSTKYLYVNISVWTNTPCFVTCLYPSGSVYLPEELACVADVRKEIIYFFFG